MSGPDASEMANGAGASTGGNYSHLPWQQIPRFTPGVTNIDDYGKRLQFLRNLWPEESVALLGPRAALMVEGSAFQKVSRIPAEKLRGPDGVRLLVESLGGSWGKTSVEEKYHFFEQAIFQCQQKTDESNDSYLARHDAFFEELLARNTQLEELRAYVLLRHSQLLPEDKKRVVVESNGNLSYDSAVKAVRLLGSKFFNDFQGRGAGAQNKASERTKVYDINMAEGEGDEEDAFFAGEEMDEEMMVAFFAERHDEDAIYCAEFEDQIIEAVQESELAPIFSAYQEARQRLREKAKARGYWTAKDRGRGKGAGKHKGKGNSKGYPRNRTLADRIANSSCRLCGAVGHWKRECPQRQQEKTEATHLAHTTEDISADPEVLQFLREDAVHYMEDVDNSSEARPDSDGTKTGERIQNVEQMVFHAVTPKVSSVAGFKEALACRLLMLDRTRRSWPGKPDYHRQIKDGKDLHVLRADRASKRNDAKTVPEETALVVTEGSEGVLDTGASRTVVGSQRVRSIIQSLPVECRHGIQKVSSDVTFRFGNSGTLSSKHALLIPSMMDRWIRVEVIPGNTPLLLSNRLLRELDAVVFVRKGIIQLGERQIQARYDDKGLLLVELAALLQSTESEVLVATCSSKQQQSHDTIDNLSHTTDRLDSQRLTSLSSSECVTQPPPDQETSSLQPARTPNHPNSRHHGAGREVQQLGEGLLGSSGCRPGAFWHGRPTPREGEASARELPGRPDRETSSDGDTTRVGGGGPRRRQAPGQHPCRDVREGPLILGADGPEEVTQQSMVTQLQSGGTGTERGWTNGDETSWSSGQSQTTPEPNDRHRGERRMETVSGSGATEDDKEIRSKCIVRGNAQNELRAHGRGEESSRHPQSAPSSGASATGGVGAAGGERWREQLSPEFRAVETSEEESRSTPRDDMAHVCHEINKKIQEIERKRKLSSNVNFTGGSSGYKLPRIEVLEVGMGVGTMVTSTVKKNGRKALFCKYKSESAGLRNQQDKLWRLIHMYEPKHIWLDVRQPWLSRKSEDWKYWWPQQFLIDVYEHQIENGRHFHLCCGPQFFESTRGDLAVIHEGVLCAVHHLPDLGKKAVWSNNNHHNRRSIILTTSRQVHQALDTRQYLAPDSHHKTNRHNNKAARQHLQLNTCAARALIQSRDVPLHLEELLIGEDTGDAPNSNVDHAQQVWKRRRLLGKQPPPGNSGTSEEASWEKVFKRLTTRVSRVGAVISRKETHWSQ